MPSVKSYPLSAEKTILCKCNLPTENDGRLPMILPAMRGVKEDIARTRKKGIANLPTMCINGEQKFISIIPSKEELVEAVKEAQAKLKK